VQGRPRIRHALGFGISQSGRVLRDLVHLGFNQDLAGRHMFDGILSVVAGSRRICVNWQFAQAGRYSRQHPTLNDPISDRSGGILQVRVGSHGKLRTGVQIVTFRFREDLALDTGEVIEAAQGIVEPIDPMW
jgi:hypothetical protein